VSPAPCSAAARRWPTGRQRRRTWAPAADLSKLEHVQVELVAPPFVHAHEQRAKGKPKVVQFRMVIEEKKLVIDEDGTEIHAMTFNGSVPGP
jgi:dissimilatory nitrite reductase (NO-forming), copper type apoprotein